MYTSPSLLNKITKVTSQVPLHPLISNLLMRDGCMMDTRIFKRPIVYQCLRQAMMQSSCARFDLTQQKLYITVFKRHWFDQVVQPGLNLGVVVLV